MGRLMHVATCVLSMFVSATYMTSILHSMDSRVGSPHGRWVEDAERTKEREFYRYYHQSQRPKNEARVPTPTVNLPQSIPTPQNTPLPLGNSPSPSEDQALTAFAQLGALRLNARRCLISFFDRRNGYILAEATRTLSLQTGQAQLQEDNLCWGTSVFPKRDSICYHTVNLPVKTDSDPSDNNDDAPTLVVNDLALDHRFSSMPCVTERPHARFYAGVPIRSPSGHNIGTYCVFDDHPRNGISAVELSFLKDMAITVMRHLQMTRASDDKRRGGLMVRSLGTFADGKTSDEWLQESWENGGASAPQTRPGSRQRRQTTAQGPNVQGPLLIGRADSTESVTPSVQASNPISPASGASYSTPASETVPDPAPDESQPRTVSSSDGEQNRGKSSDQIKALFTRAALSIGEATEADGTVFFDAKISTFGGLVDDEIAQEQPIDNADKPSAILGASSSTASGTNHLSEGVLRHLLKAYPHGQIFNLDEDISDTTQPATEIIPADVPTAALLDSSTSKPLASPKLEMPKNVDDENLLKAVFPDARSLVLYPLLDAHRDRYYAGAIMWSSDPMHVFTSEQELSYLAAFSNSIMAEVARLDTKLADAAKGDFISSISHELRSPLHGILGSCELLQDTHMDSFQQTMMQTIETCGKTLLDTINHVLDFAKINNLTRGSSKRLKKRSRSAKHAISPTQSHTNDILTLITDVDLCVLTEEVLETVFAGYRFQKNAAQVFETPSTKSDSPPIAVVVDINKSENYCFRTQPGAWRRILMNLFGNALKYTPAGYIKIKLQVIPSSDRTDDSSEFRLTITDSGIGMSEEYVNNRLFHSFAQENPLSQGTGLGLSIVKQIVKSLGGEIEAISKRDFGTKFTVCCPLKFAMMSPSGAPSMCPDRDLLNARKRTEGMKVSFVGFDEEGNYFPVKSLKNKNATMLTLKALDSLCTDWFGMKIQKYNAKSSPAPDLLVATEAGAKWLRTQNTSQSEFSSTSPVIVVCQGAASAQSTTAITVPGQVFECISQPCGPHKLAKALVSCLNRHANWLTTHSTETDSLQQDVKHLSLQENLTPTIPDTLKPPIELSAPTTFIVPESPRPRIASILSAPEIRSVQSSPTKPSPTFAHRPLHCLAVDDNPINLRLLSTFVGKLKHTYCTATNGAEALLEFKTQSRKPDSRFDVVLMDINMPEMDGLEATRQIRAYERDNGLRPTTIIALTGVASSEAQAEAHVSGVNLFMIKPVRLGELETVLKGVVIGSDAAEPQGTPDPGRNIQQASESQKDQAQAAKQDFQVGKGMNDGDGLVRGKDENLLN